MFHVFNPTAGVPDVPEHPTVYLLIAAYCHPCSRDSVAILNHFADAFGPCEPQEVDPFAVECWLASHVGAEDSETIRHWRGTVYDLFEYGSCSGLVVRNPFHPPPLPYKLKIN